MKSVSSLKALNFVQTALKLVKSLHVYIPSVNAHVHRHLVTA